MGLIVVSGTVVVLLALLEAGLRLSGQAPSIRMSQRDDHRGTARIPGVELVYTDEGFGHVRFNSAGFRDGEWAIEKPRDTFRVAILGDSYVEAMQVEEDQRFAEVAEHELNASVHEGGPRVEIMSFGMSGYGTAQELQTLRHHVWQYAPDLVVLAMTPTNDVRNNLEALEDDPGRPYFRFVDGRLVLDESFRETPEHNRGWAYETLMWLAAHSRLVDMSVRTIRLSRGEASRRAQIARTTGGDGFEDEAGLDVWVYREPQDPLQKEAWQVTEGIVRLAHEEVRTRGAGFLVMMLTSGRQVDPDPERRQAFMDRLGVGDLFFPERRLCAAGAEGGFPVLALAPAFQQLAEAQKMVLHGFRDERSSGHWNANGHREAGRRLAAAITSLRHDGHLPAALSGCAGLGR